MAPPSFPIGSLTRLQMLNQPPAMLVIEKGIDGLSVIPLDQQSCVLGKPPGADIAIDNPYVSRRHAEIVLQGSRFQIRDLGSKNGTFVNGQRLEGEGQWLQSGDRVGLAHERVVLRFQQWGITTTMPLMPSADVAVADLVVDPRSREAWVQGKKLEPPLSRKEFDIMNLLYQRRGEACSKEEIASKGWPERSEGDIGDQDIEQYIRHLRLRIESDPSRPHYILTVRGYGYKLSL